MKRVRHVYVSEASRNHGWHEDARNTSPQAMSSPSAIQRDNDSGIVLRAGNTADSQIEKFYRRYGEKWRKKYGA